MRERERGRQWAGVCKGLWGCSHWPQTGTGVWIAHIGLASKLGWTSNLLCLWSFEEKRQLPTSCLPEWVCKLGASTCSQTAGWSGWSKKSRIHPSQSHPAWIYLFEYFCGITRGNGHRSSGVEVICDIYYFSWEWCRVFRDYVERDVGGENRWIHRGRNAGRWIFNRLWEPVLMQICGVILISCDVLCCASLMTASLNRTHMHYCQSELMFD